MKYELLFTEALENIIRTAAAQAEDKLRRKIVREIKAACREHDTVTEALILGVVAKKSEK